MNFFGLGLFIGLVIITIEETIRVLRIHFRKRTPRAPGILIPYADFERHFHNNGSVRILIQNRNFIAIDRITNSELARSEI